MQILNLDSVKFPLQLELDISIAMEQFQTPENARIFFDNMFHGVCDVKIHTTPDYTELHTTVTDLSKLLMLAMWYIPGANVYDFLTTNEGPHSFEYMSNFGKITMSLD